MAQRTDGLTIVGLGGSLAATSRGRAALAVALEGAEHHGATTRLLDLRELDLPMYDPDEREPGESASQLMEACYGADGLIWSSPLYQGTISGAFKNALDWLHDLGSRDPPFLHDKVIGLVSASGGTQGLQAINTMEFSVRTLRGWAVPYIVPVATAWRVFSADGQVRTRRSRPSFTPSGWRSFALPAASPPMRSCTGMPSAPMPRSASRPRSPHDTAIRAVARVG